MYRSFFYSCLKNLKNVLSEYWYLDCKSLNLAFWHVLKLGLKPMWLVSTCTFYLWWLPVTLKCLIILGFLTVTFKIFHASAKCHKESMLVASWQNQRNGMCAQRRLRSAWESTQSDQPSLSAWRKLGSLATYWAYNEDSDQTGRMPRLIWVFAGHTCHFSGFVVRRPSYLFHLQLLRINQASKKKITRFFFIKSYLICLSYMFCLLLQ